MDSFYKIVIVVAIVVFIITMTIVGILMSNTYVGVSYPPTSGKCPDYWTMQQIGSGSSIHNVCNIPSPNSTNIGSIYNNQSNFATASSTVFMQLRDFLLAGHYYYHVSSAFTFDGEAGFLLGGKLNFIEQENKDQTVYSAGLKAGLLFKLSLKYRFSSNKNKTDLGADEFMNPLIN